MRYADEVLKIILAGIIGACVITVALQLTGCENYVDRPVLVPVPSIVLVPVDNVVEVEAECPVVTPLVCPDQSCETVEVEECSCEKIKRVKQGNGRYNIIRIGCTCDLAEREVCVGA